MNVSYRLSFLMNFVGIFISIASFFFISSLLGKSVNQYLGAYGGDYFSYVLIGIAFSGFLGTGIGAFSSIIGSAQSQGTLEAILVTPTKLSHVIIFSALWDFLFTAITVIFYMLFGSLVFGANLSHINYLSALLVLVLTTILFSGIGIISASFIMVFKRGNPLNWLFGSVSSFIGGTYFPVTVLPVWLQKIAYLFPIFYALRAMRLAVLKGFTVVQLSADILILFLFSVVVIPVSLLLFKWAVRMAKIEGSLGTY